MAKFDENDGFEYLIVRADKGGTLDLVNYMLWGDIGSGTRFLQTSSDEYLADHRWIIVVSVLIRKIISLLGKPLEYTGYALEFLLNLISLNTNLFRLIYNLFHVGTHAYSFCEVVVELNCKIPFVKKFSNVVRHLDGYGVVGKVVIPQRGTDTFISAIGHLDGRLDLYSGHNLPGDNVGNRGLRIEMGNRALMDFCMMASKLAYENARVVRNVVVHHWKMHFVDFYNCWNEFQKERSTQVFMLCDKLIDASLILISFRGTEPFDADDWSTDFDYSWYEFPKLGKVHMGFLEALGLGNRENAITFQNHLLMKHTNFKPTHRLDVITDAPVGSKTISSNIASDSKEQYSTGTGYVLPETGEMSAYYTVKEKLKGLLREHKNAKFVVTGHSLGGALAILFPTVLVVHEEKEVIQRLLGVYTFGQPRVGNRQLGRFMEAHLDSPLPRYFRVVYCNDLVPRLPYDDKTFLYKHFGVCLYYNSCYIEQKVGEEPNPNFFGLRYLIPLYLNAVWELIQSLTMGYMYGPEYEEGWFSILSRIMGLVFPGVSAHCPTNYVNSIRLGKERPVQMSAL